MRKVLNVITLIVMMSVNVMNPFTYAISLGDDFEEIQNFDEIIQEDDNFDDEEKIDDEENNEISDIEQENEDNSNENTENLSENDEDLLVEPLEGENDIQDNSLESQDNGDTTEEMLENSDDILVEPQDEEVQTELTGDNLEIDIVKESVDDISQNLVDAGESLTGDVEELTGSALELATARDTVNVESITKVGRWNNVTVNVEAPAGTFPEGTYANIRPIVSTTKLDEIKGQISEEDNTVSQESEVVAFDITFMYKLSDGTEVEVQPKENTVKVTFNYEDNDELSKADEIDQQEVKVFHIEEVKDEQGNKTGEEKVNDVTNKEESAENGIAVADAESFSIYVLTVTVGNDTYTLTLNPQGGTFVADPNITITCDQELDEQCNGTITVDASGVAKEPRFPNKDGYMFLGWFDAASGGSRFEFEGNPITSDKTLYAHWAEYNTLNFAGVVSGSLTTITIMDRNLGATTVERGAGASATSYGYYYQWGNNHGFDPNILNFVTTKPSTAGYSRSNPYYSKYFIKSTTASDSDADNEDWANPNNSELWGGGNDNKDNLYDDEGDREKRQGPCPTGYHVPSLEEWFKVVDILLQKYNIAESTNGGLTYPLQVGNDDSSKNRYVLKDINNVSKLSNIESELNINYPSNIRGKGNLRTERLGNKSDARSPFWTSSPYYDKGNDTNRVFAVEFGRTSNGFVSVGGYKVGRIRGMVVRCFKDEPDIILVKYNLGLGSWPTRESDYETYEKVNGKAEVILPEIPVLPGMVFDKWYREDSFQNEFVDGTLESDNITLYAKYRSATQSYTVRYVSDGATIYSQGVLEGTTADWGGTPTKPEDGLHRYEFRGWSNDGEHIDMNHIVNINTIRIFEDTTYYAVFETIDKDVYTVTFDSNGGSEVESPIYIEKTTPEITLPTDITKAGYTFVGWKVDGEIATSPYTLTHDTEFIAQWTPITYAIEYDYAGGTAPVSPNENPTTYNIEQDVTIYSPTKTDYSFVGWSEYRVDGEYIPGGTNTWIPVQSIIVNGDTTVIYSGNMLGARKFEAQWIKNSAPKYTVIWITDDLINPIQVSQESEGTYVSTIKPEDPENYSDAQYTYIFTGWTKGNSDTIIQDWNNERVTGFVIYKAKFDKTVNPYTVTFVDENEETISTEQYNYGSGGTDIIVPAAPDKQGYDFDGWLKKVGQDSYSTDVVDMSTEVVTADVTYKAKYSPIIEKYTITFNTNGGTEIAPISGHSGDSITPPDDPKKVGYIFSGWDQSIPSIMPAENLIITATWTPITYHITYTGVDQGYAGTDTYTIENTFIIPNPATRVGQTFKGWREYVNIAESGETPDWQEPNPGQIYYNSEGLTILSGNIRDRKYEAQWEVKTYTVFWIDENLHILEIDDNVPYGTYPSYDKQTPSKEDTAEWDYEFRGWKIAGDDTVYNNGNFPTVSGNTLYKAEYSATKRQYSVTFVDEDGSILPVGGQDSKMYLYGTHAESIIRPDNPTKEDTIEWNYEFAGWSPEIVDVTGTATYTATYSSTKQKYGVVFVDENGTTVLQESSLYEYGSSPMFTGEIPTKPDDDQGHTFEFEGWSDGTTEYLSGVELPNVTTGVTYKAVYASSTSQYDITFNPNEGDVSQTSKTVTYGQEYGELPIPQRRGYEFTGWYTDPIAGTQITSGTIVGITAKNQTLYAHWDMETYNILYYDTDEEHRITVSGATTEYRIDTAITIPVLEKEGYTFIGWKEYIDGEYTRAYLNEGHPITLDTGNVGNRKYIAKWNTEGHVVVWENWDGVIIDMNVGVSPDTHVSTLEPQEFGKPADAQYTYTFNGWTKNGEPVDISTEIVTSDVRYKATYTGTINKYKIKFVNEDETPLKDEIEYEYGTPSASIEKPSDPEKADTDEWDYEFVGWSPEVSDVTTGVTYTATYSSTKIKYEITFVNDDGTSVLGSGKYDYGTPAKNIDKPNNPTKSQTDGYTYIFSGWNPSIKEVTGNQTYIASYTPIPDKYTITFNAQGGSFVSAMVKIVTYGETYGELPTPTKLGNEFLGWYTDPTAGTQITSGTTVNTGAKNQTLYAHWEKQIYNISYYDTDEGHPITVTGATTIYTVDDFITIPNITKEGYTFVGWKEIVEGEPDRAYLSDGVNPTKIPAGNVGDRKYIALWNQHGYIIVWTNDDDTILEIDPEVGHGNTPVYDGTTPTKVETDEFTYEFAGWSPEIEPATKRQTYKATFTPRKKPYLITFIDSENDVIATGNYEYGTTAEQLMAIAPILSKSGDVECKTYEGRWSPEVVDVTGSATYTSTYICTEKKKYTITWKDWDGEILEKYTEAEYGTLPTYHGENPEKEIGDGKTYTFTWWSIDGENIIKSLPNVTGDATYTAVYTDDPNIYGVTFDPKGGVVVPYYQNVTYEQPYGNMPNPTRNGYHFDGWYDAEIGGQKIEATTIFRLTDDQTLYAYWTPITYNIMYEEVDSGYLAPTSYTVLSRIEIPHPNKEGHKFLGWKGYICNKTDINQCSGTDREHIGNILKEGDNTTLPEGTTLNRKYVAQWEANEYAVTWISNGNLLKVNMLPYGSIPVYSREVPFREPDAQYTYTFTGWSDGIKEYGKDENLPEVNGIVTYSAIFSSTTNKYNISFVDEDGTPLQSTQLEYGEIPSYDTGTYGIPVKEGNAQYTYTFAGWTPEISEVITGATYKATYTGTINKYNISFVDEDGITVLGSGEYEYGTPVTNIEKPVNPTKTGDAQYTYEFAGWTPEISEVITGTTYKATYTGIINKYTVTFDSDGGSEIDPITVDYGTGIQAPEEPIKRGYTFLKWQKIDGEEILDYDFEIPVTQDITLKAIWTKDNYTVVYKDGNEILSIEGATTGYTVTDEIIIPNPSKEGYTFVAWKEYVKTGDNTRIFVKDILKDGDSTTLEAGNIGDREFRAQWRVNQYTVTFANYDRSILKVEMLNYGSGVIYDKAEPTKMDETGQYTYTFSGWKINGEGEVIKTENIPIITGNVTYIAYFDEEINKYEIKFVDEDGTPLQSTQYEYGTLADAITKPSDPEKEDTPEWDYEFEGWSPEVSDVTTGATYKAIYSQTKQKYEVIFVDEDEITVLGSGEYEYGTDARLIERPANPTKETTDEYTYTFAGWTPTIVNVTTGATYTATYSGMANQYTVTLDLNEGEANPISIIITYGQKYGELPIPERKGYEFTGWYTDPTAGIQITSGTTVNTGAKNQTLYARWTINNYTISYFDQDGTTELIIPLATTGYTVNDTIIIPNPSKDEYTFIGWKEYVDGQYTKAYLSEGTGITIPAGNVGNIKYVAQWNKNGLSQGFVVLWIDWNDVILDMNTNIESGTSIANISKPANPTRKADEGYTYTFANWTKDGIDIPDISAEIVTDNVKYKAKYNTIVNKYKVTFVDENGTVLKETKEYEYGTNFTLVDKPNNPTKAGYTFIGWKPELPQRVPAEDLVFVAQWNKSGGNSSGGGGGGGGGGKSNNSQDKNEKNNVNTGTKNDTHGAAGDEEDSNGGQDNIIEMSDNLDLSLYKWARKNSITTMDTIEEADSEGYLLRGHLAKILVNFSVNVLGREMPTETPKWCKRKDKDYEWDSDEIKFYSEKACAMGLMGLYVEEFMPNKIVDRAEFGTVVSRMLWGDTYNELDTYYHPYYEKHLKALQENGIMKDIDNPLGRREIRKRVWLVLKRIEQEKNSK